MKYFTLLTIFLFPFHSPLFGEAILSITSGQEAELYINNENHGSITPSGALEITLKKPNKYVIEIRAKNSPLIHREEINVTKLADIKKTISAFPKEETPSTAQKVPDVSEKQSSTNSLREVARKSGFIKVNVESYYDNAARGVQSFGIIVLRQDGEIPSSDFKSFLTNSELVTITTLLTPSLPPKTWQTINPKYAEVSWANSTRGYGTKVYISDGISIPTGKQRIYVGLIVLYQQEDGNYLCTVGNTYDCDISENETKDIVFKQSFEQIMQAYYKDPWAGFSSWHNVPQEVYNVINETRLISVPLQRIPD